MAGNIRILGTAPKTTNGLVDPTKPDVIFAVFTFPVENAVAVADVMSEKLAQVVPALGKGIQQVDVTTPAVLDPKWKTVPEAVAYQQAGGVAQVGVDSIDPKVAALFTDGEKAAIEGGTVTAPITVPVQLHEGWALADLNDPTSALRKTLNLMWNQARKNMQDHYDADRARLAAPEYGMVLDEITIDDLANIPKDLQP